MMGDTGAEEGGEGDEGDREEGRRRLTDESRTGIPLAQTGALIRDEPGLGGERGWARVFVDVSSLSGV